MGSIDQKIEQLAVAQSVFKLAAEAVSTKEPDNLRAQVDEHYREMWEQTGAKTFDVRIGDTKVGTYSVRESKPKTQDVLEISDMKLLTDWCELCGYMKCAPDMDKINIHFAETGELPPGMELITHNTPGGYAGGTFKVDVPAVNTALGGLFEKLMLLEGSQ